jgi:hypothetical protein
MGLPALYLPWTWVWCYVGLVLVAGTVYRLMPQAVAESSALPRC